MKRSANLGNRTVASFYILKNLTVLQTEIQNQFSGKSLFLYFWMVSYEYIKSQQQKITNRRGSIFMKKSKSWIALFVLSLTLVAVIAGCGTTAGADDIGKTRTANDLEMTVTHVETLNSKNDKMQLAKIDFEITNVGSDEAGVGAGDFVVETKGGKKREVDGMHANNFGDAIAAGKMLRGSGYYEVPAGEQDVTVIYKPVNGKADQKATWTITLPEK